MERTCVWCGKTYQYDTYNLNRKDFLKNFCSKRCSKKYDEQRFYAFKSNNHCERHKRQKISYKGECWDCYCEPFLEELKEIHRIKCKWRLAFRGFKMIPTFRSNDSDDWRGSRAPFEQSLVYMKMRWVVYVKFYINNKNGKIRPLVVGKSGSKSVNSSGTDLNFSNNVEDGEARRFLSENKDLEWEKRFVMIKSCFTEKGAYKLESKIKRKFDLFSS